MEMLEKYVTEMRAFQNDLMHEQQKVSHTHEDDLSPAIILDEIGEYGNIYNSITARFSMRTTDEMLDYFLDDYDRIHDARPIMLKFIHNMYELIGREANEKKRTLDYLTHIYDNDRDDEQE